MYYKYSNYRTKAVTNRELKIILIIAFLFIPIIFGCLSFFDNTIKFLQSFNIGLDLDISFMIITFILYILTKGFHYFKK